MTVGRSGRSTREARTVCYNHIRHPQQRELVVHDRVVDDAALALAGRGGDSARSIHSGMCGGAFFWKKLLPCQPSDSASS